MNIFLNFVALKSGGSVQAGLDFLVQLKKFGGEHAWHLIATKGTPFESVEETPILSLAYLVPDNFVSRIWFEYVWCRRLVQRIKPDVVFTLFGGSLPGINVHQIVGCANPHYMYPEVEFSDVRSMAGLLLVRLRRRYGRKRLFAADEVILETPMMRERAIRVLGFSPGSLHIVAPACSSLVHPDKSHPETAMRCTKLPPGFRVLLISGYRRHKNIEMLPRIAELLKAKCAFSSIVFVTTLDPHHPATAIILEDARARGVQSMIHNLGPIPFVGCADLYRAVDAIILPSRLESFSNTIAEAWVMEKPLLISELDWARSACGEAAMYFPYDDAEDAARKLCELKNNPSLRETLVKNGRKRRENYPTPEERFLNYKKIIEASGLAETARHGPSGATGRDVVCDRAPGARGRYMSSSP